jgi:isoleucyl-tRNA synthetase
MEVGKAYNLPVLQTVAPDGAFIDAVTEFRGMWVKDADPEIRRDLQQRGLLYKAELYEHSYPFCWRCHTPLLYYARDSWFIRTTAYRDKLVALNQTINWVPEHIRDGRWGASASGARRCRCGWTTRPATCCAWAVWTN